MLNDIRELAAWPELREVIGQHPRRTEIELLVTLLCLQARANAEVDTVSRLMRLQSTRSSAAQDSSAKAVLSVTHQTDAEEITD